MVFVAEVILLLEIMNLGADVAKIVMRILAGGEWKWGCGGDHDVCGE
jgi:hypothetical protein